MPQLRSFSSFPATPNLGEAWQGGTALAQRDTELAAKVQNDREQLANQYAIAEMETATRRAALSQQQLQQQQELEVQKAYQQSVIGLRQRDVEQQQQQIDLKSEEAARQFSAQESIRREVEDVIAKGGDVSAGFRNSLMKHGTQAGVAGPAMGDVLASGPGGANAPMGVPVAIDLKDEAGNPTGQKIYQSSLHQYSTLPKAELPPTYEKNAAPGFDRIGKRFFVSGELKDAEKEVDRLGKWFDGQSAVAGELVLKKQASGQELKPWEQSTLEAYQKKQKELKDAKNTITRLRSATPGGGSGTNSPIKSIRLRK